jgi:hypothetical protein
VPVFGVLGEYQRSILVFPLSSIVELGVASAVRSAGPWSEPSGALSGFGTGSLSACSRVQ